MQVSDEYLVDAYGRLNSVWKVAAEVGMSGQQVHARLAKLGAVRPQNLFTEAEIERLKREYHLFADAGLLDSLAKSMDRTKHLLCRHARLLGITDNRRPKSWNAVWKYLSPEAAEAAWAGFKKSSLGLGMYCKKRGFDDLGFSRAMQGHFPDEYEHVIESKTPKTTKYRRGRQFEYSVRDGLKRHGFFVMRSPASKSPIDLVAIRTGETWFIQCKTSGSLPVGEWNELFVLARSVGAVPVMSCRSAGGRGFDLFRMTDVKDGSKRRQPMEPLQP